MKDLESECKKVYEEISEDREKINRIEKKLRGVKEELKVELLRVDIELE